MSNSENKNLGCDIVGDLLELYHDKIVKPTTAIAVKEHLDTCEKCKKEYEKIKETLPSSAESSTKKVFSKTMKKKKTKQIITTVICCLLACLILTSSYLLLTEAHLRVRDVEVHKVYKYEAPDGKDFFFVLYTYQGNSSSSSRIEVKREFTENPDTERTSLVYDRMIPIITSHDYDGTYTDIGFFRADKISTKKQGIIDHLDCDELIMDGEVVWSKELNADDEVPGYVQVYYDIEYVYNQDEFGNSDEMSISTSIDTDNLDSDENYICAYYPDKTIKWNLKGEVIEEKIKEDYKKPVTAE